MALRFMDGFDYYSSSDITRKWTSRGIFATIDTTTKRTGLGALRIEDNSSIGNILLTLDSQTSWVVGFAVHVITLGSVSKNFRLEFIDGVTVQCSLTLNTNGTLEVVRSVSTAVTDGISSEALSINTWYYVEIKVTISNSISASSCIVKVNGATWITVATGQDLQSSGNSSSNSFEFENDTGGPSYVYIDDLYIFDGTGSQNNDFAGDTTVEALHPDGNGNSSQFTGSDGNSVDNYLLVDETDTDDDTSYNENNAVGEIDLYTFGNISGAPSAIKGVQVNQVVRKDDAGSRTIRAVARPTSTNFFGDSKSPSNGSYTNEIHIWEQNPQTAADWTQSNLDATEFGIEIET